MSKFYIDGEGTPVERYAHTIGVSQQGVVSTAVTTLLAESSDTSPQRYMDSATTINVVKYNPLFNGLWSASQSPIKDFYDMPLISSEKIARVGSAPIPFYTSPSSGNNLIYTNTSKYLYLKYENNTLMKYESTVDFNEEALKILEGWEIAKSYGYYADCIHVQLQGGGGGGGNGLSYSDGAYYRSACGAGGGGGAYIEFIYKFPSTGSAFIKIKVGAGGTGRGNSVADPNNDFNGEDTVCTFYTNGQTGKLIAGGGKAPLPSNYNNVVSGGSGGICTGSNSPTNLCDIIASCPGAPGGDNIYYLNSGAGGKSVWDFGEYGRIITSTESSRNYTKIESVMDSSNINMTMTMPGVISYTKSKNWKENLKDFAGNSSGESDSDTWNTILGWAVSGSWGQALYGAGGGDSVLSYRKKSGKQEGVGGKGGWACAYTSMNDYSAGFSGGNGVAIIAVQGLDKKLSRL